MSEQSRIGRRKTVCPICKCEVRFFGQICNACNDKAQRTTRAEKIQWLLLNQKLWERFPRPGINHSFLIFTAMQQDGLYSVSTRWTDADITGLISDARKQRREDGAKEAGLKHCKGCGYPIHSSCTYCGECLCEEDGR